MPSTRAITVSYYTDPACPWAYSSEPFLTTLRWRYGDALRWRIVMIGLAEEAADYARRGYKTTGRAASNARYGRRFGMPMLHAGRDRLQGTGRACRAFKAAEPQGDELARAFLRALRFGYFCTLDRMDDDEGIRRAATTVAGLDVEAVIAGIDDPRTEAAYQADRAETRRVAELGPGAVAQGKTANTDGAERFTATSLTFERDGLRLTAGGWQALDAYDVCVANVAPELRAREAPTPLELVTAFPHGVTTQEVARACTPSLADVDRTATLEALLDGLAAGDVERVPLGDDALWRPRSAAVNVPSA